MQIPPETWRGHLARVSRGRPARVDRMVRLDFFIPSAVWNGPREQDALATRGRDARATLQAFALEE